MTIKYYRKKGTDKATHKAEIRYESGYIAKDGLGQHIAFIRLLTNIIYDVFRGEDAFNEFLEENGFEEVMDDSKTPDPNATLAEGGKMCLDCSKKLELELKQIKNGINRCRILNGLEPTDFSKCEPSGKTGAARFDSLNHLVKERQSKEDVKLPEVGGSYQNRYYNLIIKVIRVGESDNGRPKVFYEKEKDYVNGSIVLSLFWENFEKLPEDIQANKINAPVHRVETNGMAKSIWKDVSELPKKSAHYIIRGINGDIVFGVFDSRVQKFLGFREQLDDSVNISEYPKENIKEYCQLTDYINNTENFQQEVLERLKKLEGK